MGRKTAGPAIRNGLGRAAFSMASSVFQVPETIPIKISRGSGPFGMARARGARFLSDSLVSSTVDAGPVREESRPLMLLGGTRGETHPRKRGGSGGGGSKAAGGSTCGERGMERCSQMQGYSAREGSRRLACLACLHADKRYIRMYLRTNYPVFF